MKRGSRLSKAPVVLSALAGALGQFFFDRRQGRRRRIAARDRTTALLRRRSRDAARKLRYAEGVGQGVAHETARRTRSATTEPRELDDVTLTRKVESEAFRDAAVPKGDINVNVEHGVVYLRGQLEHAEQIEELVEAAQRVEGVREVESLLHLPGTPAPARGGPRRAAETT